MSALVLTPCEQQHPRAAGILCRTEATLRRHCFAAMLREDAGEHLPASRPPSSGCKTSRASALSHRELCMRTCQAALLWMTQVLVFTCLIASSTQREAISDAAHVAILYLPA
jgi:hypothetical protein